MLKIIFKNIYSKSIFFNLFVVGDIIAILLPTMFCLTTYIVILNYYGFKNFDDIQRFDLIFWIQISMWLIVITMQFAQFFHSIFNGKLKILGFGFLIPPVFFISIITLVNSYHWYFLERNETDQNSLNIDYLNANITVLKNKVINLEDKLSDIDSNYQREILPIGDSTFVRISKGSDLENDFNKVSQFFIDQYDLKEEVQPIIFR